MTATGAGHDAIGGGQTASTPPWRRNLTGADAARAQEAGSSRSSNSIERGDSATRSGPPASSAELRARVQGADHWQAADARRDVDDLRTIAALPEEGRKAMATVGDLVDKADAASQTSPICRIGTPGPMLLQVNRRWLGEDHRRTARAYNNLTLQPVSPG